MNADCMKIEFNGVMYISHYVIFLLNIEHIILFMEIFNLYSSSQFCEA